MPHRCPNCNRHLSSPPPTGDEERTCPHCQAVFSAADAGNFVGELSPGSELGGFRIERRLGVGGMGSVYLARQLSLNRPVALKVLSQRLRDNAELLHRFLLEARATAALEHPHIVSLYEAGEEDGVCFLAVAYVDGESLDRVLERGETLPETTALKMARQIAKGLDYAWRRQQLLHRDIKPANIMIDRQGAARLCDLGIAKRQGDEYQIGRQGIAVGTPHYMSPEQARGEMDLDCRADIYALGATLYHLLGGEYPFDAESAVTILSMQINDEPRPLRDVAPGVSVAAARLVAGMMAKHRRDRYQDWATVIADVDRVLRGDLPAFEPPAPGASTGTETPPPPAAAPLTRGTGRRLGRQNLLLGAICLALTILVGALTAAVIILQRGRTVTPAPPPPPDLATTIEAVHLQPDDPAKTPADDGALVEQIRAAAENGVMPRRLAVEFLRRGENQAAERLLELCLDPASGVDPDYATDAAKALGIYYRRRQQYDRLEAVLRRRLDPAAVNPRDAAAAYHQLAGLLRQQGRDDELEALLAAAIRDNPDDHWVCAHTAGIALADHYARRGDAAQTAATIAAVLAAIPVDDPLHQSFRQWAASQQPEALAAAEAPPPVDAPEPRSMSADQQVTAILKLLAAEEDAAARTRLYVQLARLHQDAARYAAAAQQYQRALDAAQRAAGLVQLRAEILLALAECYRQTGNDAARARCLSQLLDAPYADLPGDQGLAAAKALVRHYQENGNFLLRDLYLEKIVKDYPGPDNTEAVEALLLLARGQEQQKKFFLALTTLDRIGNDFPGADGRHARRALAERARIVAEHPRETAPFTNRDEQTVADSPIANGIRFDGLTNYLAVQQPDLSIDQAAAITVELWVLASGGMVLPQYLVSRSDDQAVGFNLVLRGGKLVWETYDGEQRQVVETPPGTELPRDRWVHVAVTAGQEFMAIYVDGKEVAVGACSSPANANAGRLHIGRRAADPSGYFNGSLQNVMVYTDVVYTAPFRPQPAPRNAPSLRLCVVRRNNRVYDLKQGALETHLE